jgi:hypothetical protein
MMGRYISKNGQFMSTSGFPLSPKGFKEGLT